MITTEFRATITAVQKKPLNNGSELTVAMLKYEGEAFNKPIVTEIEATVPDFLLEQLPPVDSVAKFVVGITSRSYNERIFYNFRLQKILVEKQAEPVTEPVTEEPVELGDDIPF